MKELRELDDISGIFLEYSVYVYGAGRWGKALTYFCAENNLWIDGIVVTELKEKYDVMGIPVISIDDVNIDNKKIRFVVCTNARYREEILKILEDRGIDSDSVYYMTEEIYRKIAFKNHDGLYESEYRQKELKNLLYENRNIASVEMSRYFDGFIRYQPWPEIRYFILNIIDHCNLNCKGCNHFSSLAEEGFVDKQIIENDLLRMHEVHGDIQQIGIMGGEPFLHPQLSSILQCTRKIFPKAELLLSSNATLCKNMDDNFWNVCADNNIICRFSRYPIGLDYEGLAKELNEKGIKTEWFGDEKTTFNGICMDMTGRQDPRRSFFFCEYANRCIFLSRGKLYTCQVIPNINHFCRAFNLNLNVSEEDYIDIYKCGKDETLSQLAKPKPFCRYCNSEKRMYTTYEWGITNKECIDEWV